jgi:hypothetical protein
MKEDRFGRVAASYVTEDGDSRADPAVVPSEEIELDQAYRPKNIGNLARGLTGHASKTAAYRSVSGGEIMGSKVTRQYGLEVHTLTKLRKCQDRYLSER